MEKEMFARSSVPASHGVAGRLGLSPGMAHALLLGLLGASFLLGVGMGTLPLSPGQVLAILLRPLGLDLPWAFEERQAAVLLAIRLPRVVLAGLVGAGLSVAGAALQGLFRNPLAEPGLIGVSSGAALGAAAMLVAGGGLLANAPAPLAVVLLPAAAFAGGLSVTVVVYRISTRGGSTNVATMLLAGVAFNALAGAGTGLFTYLADNDRLRDIVFWMLGSLGGATWAAVVPAIFFILVPVGLALRLGSRLNALSLGEAEAYHLGVSVERVKRTIFVLTAIAVGTAVALSGIIGFVGLVVPHMIRLAAGPDHRRLLPSAALLGASLLILADLLARTVLSPAELPIGILTALAGAPFFLWLLVRERRRPFYL